MVELYTVHGKNYIQMVKDLIDSAKPLGDLDKNAYIGIKPNLVWASEANYGATTHPEIAEGVIQYLNEHGYRNIVIMESSWVGEDTKKAFYKCGYNELEKKYNVELKDLKDDEYYTQTYKDIKFKICKTYKEIDYLINLPLIKGHGQTNITCALKNMKGIIPDSEKRRFHRLGLHRPIAYLNCLIKQDLIIADGICPDPYCEDGGSPTQTDRIILAFDPVVIDSYACKLLGYSVNEVEYIKLANEEGVGKLFTNNKIVKDIYGDNETIAFKRKEKKYLQLIDESLACSRCYSNLISALEKLDNEGYINRIVENISIGQGFRGVSGQVGVGDCTKDFNKSLKGCPPTRDEIYEFLKKVY